MWGTIRIILDRGLNFDYHTYDPGAVFDGDVSNAVWEDDVWGFGQVVAVALLLAPLFFFFESIYGKCEGFSNATFVWTIWNYTKRLSPTESVIMDRKKSGQLPTSASTHPTSPHPASPHPASTHSTSPHPGSNPGSSSAEPWTALYECGWFRSLVWLIYLLNLVIATVILYLFPFSNRAVYLKDYIRSLIRFFLGWFGFDLALLLLFTLSSLSLCYAQDTLSKRTNLIQNLLLIVGVLFLAVSSGLYGWYQSNSWLE